MATKDEAQGRIQELQDELRRVKVEEQERLWASRRCRGCGEPDEEDGGEKGYLTDLQVTLSSGEEGHSDLKVWICSFCLEDFQEAMNKLNLTIHKHGGICFLEDAKCPGYADMDSCPTPERQYPGVYWDEDNSPEQ